MTMRRRGSELMHPAVLVIITSLVHYVDDYRVRSLSDVGLDAIVTVSTGRMLSIRTTQIWQIYRDQY